MLLMSYYNDNVDKIKRLVTIDVYKRQAVSLACRYLHSAVGQIAQDDFHSSETLIMKLAERIAGSEQI